MSPRSPRWLWTLLAVGAACSSSSGNGASPDAIAPDSTANEAGAPDSTASDAGPSDAVTPESGPLEASADAGAEGGDAAVDPSVMYKSGARLRAVYLTTQDGARDFRGWRDTQLNLDCQLISAEDFRVRCLPSGAPISFLYSDAQCSQPVLALNAGGTCPSTTPPYVLEGASKTCQLGYRVRTPGAKITPTQLFASSGGSGSGCISQGVSAGSDYYALGPAIAASTYVGATDHQLVEPSLRLNAVFHVADDGARQWQGWVDSVINEPCHPYFFAANDPRCTPSPVAYDTGSTFSDRTCTTPVAGASTACGGPAGQFIERDVPSGGSCGVIVPHFFRKGSAVAVAYAGAADAGTCAAVPDAGAGETYLSVGTEELPSALALIPSVPTGTTRIQPYVFTPAAVDGHPVRMVGYQYKDSMLGIDCYFDVAGDGKTRCLPATYADGAYFNDAACTQPIATFPSDNPCNGPFPAYASVPDTNCPPRTKIFAIGAKVTPAAVYGLNGATCVTRGVSGEFHALGAEVVPSTFASATLVTE
jgi:hypothetical protein